MSAHVFITGATGFIGQYALGALHKEGHKVTALCRSENEELTERGVAVHVGDVLDPDTFKDALKGVDFVIHGAGYVSRHSPLFESRDSDRAFGGI